MNEKEQLILNHAKPLVIFETNDIVETTGINYALVYKYLTGFSDMGLIEKHKGFWRLEGCKSEYGEHAQLLTKAIAEILKTPFKSMCYRERTISEIGLRPDLTCLLINKDMGRCFILEVMNNETEAYFQQKKHAWENWDSARDYLSTLFGYLIPHFDIITEIKPYLEGL